MEPPGFHHVSPRPRGVPGATRLPREAKRQDSAATCWAATAMSPTGISRLKSIIHLGRQRCHGNLYGKSWVNHGKNI